MNSRTSPFNPDTLFQQALSLHHMGRLNEAGDIYKKLLAYFPNRPEVLTPFGTLLLQQGQQEEGIKQLERSLHIAPKQPMALYNLGSEFQKLTRLEEALACYDQAIVLNHNDPDTYVNRGNVLKDLKRCDEALASYNLAIALKPDYAPAYWNKSLLKILTGEYEEGWQLYEWGWKCSERGTVRNFSQPRWRGEQSIAGKTLLIHAEQGLGDVIQFCRYAPMAEALGAKVVLEAPASLVSLLSTLKGNFTIVEKGKGLPDFDMVCPIMSLPLAFKTTVESIPATVPYLYVNRDKQAEWHQRLGKKTRPRVGLVWSGSITHKNDHNRSIALKSLEPLLQLPVEFHLLQKEIRPDDREALSFLNQIQLHQDELDDFSDTAALVQEMDLTISVDTSVAHLAGSIGRNAWLLLPFLPDYRWMLDRADSPWYPTVTLIRQHEIGNWSGVIAETTQRLRAMFL